MSTAELTKRPNGVSATHEKRQSIVKSEDDMTNATLLTNEDVIGVYLVLLSAVIDILGVAMVVPILPYYAESFGADAAQLGFLYSAFSASAVVATLVMGTLSDIFGRRALIIISLFGSCSGFIFHGLCQNYNQLLAARIYTGFFSSSMTIAQAYIADVVPGPQQPKYMANLGAATGMTFMVGPTIGGAITAAANDDYSVPYYVAASIAGLGMIFAAFKLKEPKKKEDEAGDLEESVEVNNLTEQEEFVQDLLKSRLLGFPIIVYVLGWVRFCSQIGWTAQTSMFALFAMEKFGISAVYLSTMMMVGSICYVITNVTVFKWMVAKFNLVNTMSLGMMIMAIAIILYSVPGSEGLGNLWLTFIIQWLCFIGLALYMPSITSLFARFTTPGERGKILGCGSVFMSGADIVGPIVFGLLYRQDINLVWYVGGCSLLSGFIILRVVDAVLKKMKVKWKKMKTEVHVDVKPAVEEDWVYEKDEAYTDEDYTELGKRIGEALSFKNWRWKMKMDNVVRVVEYSFPHIPKEVLTKRKMWDDFWEYSIQIWREISLIYNRRDEDYMLAQGQGWDFSTVQHEPVDLSKAFSR